MLPSLQFLEQIPQRILNIPNKRKESKRKEHYCLFLLGNKAGLRVSEAINFDLSKKTHNGLYRIEKSKGKKERLAYIPKQVINELKKHD
jgi:site-specific recombinase XerD